MAKAWWNALKVDFHINITELKKSNIDYHLKESSKIN
jgi:hypothetical protein